MMNTNKQNMHKRNQGFSLVEILVVAPIVILMIGIFVGAIVSMTGDVLSTRASNSLSYDIQDALSRIEQDVKNSGAFLATNSIALTSPQGYNNDTTAFHNADATNGTMLILNSYATTNNPTSSTRSLVYMSNQPNACSSSQVSQNSPMMLNTIYFVKDNILWRRVIVPSGYTSMGCVSGALGTPWQTPSCAPNISGPLCKTTDEKLVKGIQSGGFSINYYPSSDSTTANSVAIDSGQTDAARFAALQTTNTVSVTLSASDTIAGRDISQTGTIRSVSLNNNATINTGITTKNLLFDASSDLTSNFTQTLGSSSAYQTVSNGYVYFDNSADNLANNITTNFLSSKRISYWKMVASFWSSIPNYFWPTIKFGFLDASNNVVNHISIPIDYYSACTNCGGLDDLLYPIRGLIGWNITETGTAFTSLGTVPDRVQGTYHTYELYDLENGTYQFKLDGVNYGSPINLGNASYRMGDSINLDPLLGKYGSTYYDSNAGCYLTEFTVIYH